MVVRISLKDALRERPTESGGPLSRGAPKRTYENGESITQRALRAVKSYNTNYPVTCQAMWDAATFRTFEFLTDMLTSPDPKERDQGKKWYEDFERKHGLQKCTMMLNESRRRAQQNWYADKTKGGKGK
jgi:hypothetical protein